MRIVVLALLALSTAGCAGGVRSGRSFTAPVTPAVAGSRSPAAPTGPVEARLLARRNGLAFRDTGDGVLLESADLRARFFPGRDQMTLDGRSVPMGAAAVRSDGALIVPPLGARAVEQGVAEARARKAKNAAELERIAREPAIPAPAAIPVVAPARGAIERKPATPEVAPGDPAWVAAAPDRAWRWIVVHHSDDTSGNAAKYDRVHLEKGWEHGLGYHFVIGNGSMSGDGDVEVGSRWTRQLHGAHAKTDDNRYNDFGVGIVLVGDFEHGTPPTRRQYDACVRLTRWLMVRYGITPDRVLRHSDCKATCCPGPGFPWARFLTDIASTDI